MPDELEKLAAEISKCTACDQRRIKVEHVAPMRRGAGEWGIIIGEGPGKKEVSSAEAFSGLAGKKLVEWLVSTGIVSGRDGVFKLFYLTSVTKCRVLKASAFTTAASTCLPFLHRQLELINPSIVITLGSRPLKILLGYEGLLEDVIGNVYVESEFAATLFPIFGATPIVPLPHPSPVSRWTNDEEHKRKLRQALDHIRRLYHTWGA